MQSEKVEEKKDSKLEFILRKAGIPNPLYLELYKEGINLIDDSFSERQVLETLILQASQRIHEDELYDFASSRLFMLKVILEVCNSYEVDYRKYFPKYIKQAIGKRLLDERLADFNLDLLASNLNSERDSLLTYNSLVTLYDRYLVRDIESDTVIELPQAFWMRVAMGLSLNEKKKEEWAIKFYEIMSSLKYIPSTPTLFNSGTRHNQLASCYLYDVQDSLDHILSSAYEFGILAKYAGGIGTAVTKIRASGSPVRGISGKSGGLIPFLHMYDALIKCISQGGRRRGTMAVYLEPWHLEIESFLDLKKTSGDPYLRTPTLNTVLWVPDEFFKRIENDTDWYMFDPAYVKDLAESYGKEFEEKYKRYIELAERGKVPANSWRKIKARELYAKIIASLLETGHPWITFKDTANIRSMLKRVGMIHSSNLCTEVFLPTSKDRIAVCNLGSINLARHIKHRNEIDYETLKQTIGIAVRCLDNVIDINMYPSKKAERSNKENRPIGLGVMGFSELLCTLGIPYDNAAEITDELFEFISYQAISASHELSLERGSFKNFSKSEWSKGKVPIDTIKELELQRGIEVSVKKEGKLDWNKLRKQVIKGMRNGAIMAVAPTATISIIAGTTPSLDPYFSNIYSRTTLSGKFFESNKVLRKILSRSGLWERALPDLIENSGDLTGLRYISNDMKKIFKTAYQISPEAYIEIASRAQKWVDMGISRNMFVDAKDVAKAREIYLSAWKKGLKSTYYLFNKTYMKAEPSTIHYNKSEKKPEWLVKSYCSTDQECVSCQ